jgi:hypothetical protein
MELLDEKTNKSFLSGASVVAMFLGSFMIYHSDISTTKADFLFWLIFGSILFFSGGTYLFWPRQRWQRW